MSLLVTGAIVLHVQDYLESSSILRLATREAGVQSVVARGAKRSKVRYGSAMDLFAEGNAQIQVKDNRELNTLASFEVTKIRTGLASDMGKFTAASAISELILRFARDDEHPELYHALSEGLDQLGSTRGGISTEIGIMISWRMVAMLGFAPTIDNCANCHARVPADTSVAFSHSAGGALCTNCARFAPGARVVPPDARRTIGHWLAQSQNEMDSSATHLPQGDIRAHLRLLREFLREHLSGDKPMRAVDVWAKGGWG